MRYLFYVAKYYSLPIIQPLRLHLLGTTDEFGLLVSRKVHSLFPEEWRSDTVLENVQEAVAYKPDFVLSPGNFVDFRIPGVKVQIFHGLGVEKESHFKIRHFFDIYLTSGPYVTERFRKLQRKHKYFLVAETGWPKIDYILQYPTEDLRAKFNIPDSKKIILYAPTFSDKMHSASELLPKIPSLVRNDEIWLMKFHEFMSKDIIRDLKKERFEWLRLIDHYDITPYLHIADVLVSDTSSVVYEFMVLDKPIITFRTLSRCDKGINIEHASDLRTAIDRSLQQPGEFQRLRQEHLGEVNPYLDGEISSRVFRTLAEMHDKLPAKRRPFNLLRKCQILYHEAFRKGYMR
jgi:CDP-glycerol glycerophosphotransferase (TagB/SpsB family)